MQHASTGEHEGVRDPLASKSQIWMQIVNHANEIEDMLYSAILGSWLFVHHET